MKILLTEWRPAATCTWCERERESVTAAFDDNFLAAGPLCWKCLQQAVRVKSRKDQTASAPTPKPSSDRSPSDKSP